jgi:hypothetical protein
MFFAPLGGNLQVAHSLNIYNVKNAAGEENP